MEAVRSRIFGLIRIGVVGLENDTFCKDNGRGRVRRLKVIKRNVVVIRLGEMVGIEV